MNRLNETYAGFIMAMIIITHFTNQSLCKKNAVMNFEMGSTNKQQIP